MLKFYGIQHQRTVAYTPEQNGCVEREMRTVVELARTMLLSSNLNKNLWAEAVNTAVFVINRTGMSIVKDKTSYELWWNKDMYNISDLRIFGSKVGVHIPTQRRLKFDSKPEIGYLVGYGESVNVKGYRIYIPEKNNVEIKRDVVFIKGKKKENDKKQNEKCISFDIVKEYWSAPPETENAEDEHNGEDNELNYESISEGEARNEEPLEIEEESIIQEVTDKEKEGRPKRKCRKPKWMEDYLGHAELNDSSECSFLSFTGEEPITYEEEEEFMVSDQKNGAYRTIQSITDYVGITETLITTL